ncbi:MAG: hypothetical protein QHJ73_12560 [Armatimonadota bacterium]|nr:hypothetical protein [Armatimonadota bacterium]
MRTSVVLSLLLSAVVPAAAQFPGGGMGVPQVGINASPFNVGLAPGEVFMMAAYCGALLDDPPTYRDLYLPAPGSGRVRDVEGFQYDLREAVESGMVLVRGRGPADRPRLDRGYWIDLYLVNLTPRPLEVAAAAGAVFQPLARTGRLPASYRFVSRLQDPRLTGSDVACFAAWAATGSTRADIEHTLARLVTDEEAALCGTLLGTPLKEGTGEYQSLFRRATEALGADPAQRFRAVRFPSGLNATLVVRRGAHGRAVAEAQTAAGRSLYYGATVAETSGGRWQVQLTHLKTGKPLAAMPQWVLEAPPAEP